MNPAKALAALQAALAAAGPEGQVVLPAAVAASLARRVTILEGRQGYLEQCASPWEQRVCRGDLDAHLQLPADSDA